MSEHVTVAVAVVALSVLGIVAIVFGVYLRIARRGSDVELSIEENERSEHERKQ